MAILTPRLQIPKPEGNEYVSRGKFNEIYDAIDSRAASVDEVNSLSTQIDDLNTQVTMNQNNITDNTNNISILQTQTADLIATILPSGLVMLWSGQIVDIPDGWALCDGSTYNKSDGSGTIISPDLRNRFIVGAGNEYNVDNLGGEKEHTLTISELPSHKHSDGTLYTSSSGYHSHSASTSTTGDHTHTFSHPKKTEILRIFADGNDWSILDFNEQTGSSGSHSHSVTVNSAGSHTHSIMGETGAVGGNTAHENRPPYYALAYIIKL